MIFCYRANGISQRINNKLVRVGYKILVMAETYMTMTYEAYQGVKKGKQVVSSTKWELGENVVLQLMECLPLIVKYYGLYGLLFHVFSSAYPPWR